MSDLKLVSFNVRGIRHAVKRRSLFRFFHQHYSDYIIVLQETHSSERDVKYWRAEWGGGIFFSHGSSSSECGVAVLLPRVIQASWQVNLYHSDGRGRLLMLTLVADVASLKLVAVYAPTQSHAKQQLEFLRALETKIDEFTLTERDNLIM